MKHSFDHQLDHVEFDTYTPNDAKLAIDGALKTATNNIRELKKIPLDQLTFRNTVLGLTRCSEQLDYVTNIIAHLASMRLSTWKEAKDYAMAKVTDFGYKLQYDKELYERLVRVAKTLKDPKELRLTTELIKDYEDNGIALDAAKQKRLAQIGKKRVKLGSSFRQNIQLIRESHPLHITDKKLLGGLSDTLVASFKREAKNAGKTGYVIPVNDASWEQILTGADSPKLRKMMQKAYSASNPTKNLKLLHQILNLRREQAKILGYRSPGHMLMRKRMVNDPARAIEFIEKLASKYAQLQQNEYKALDDYYRKKTGANKPLEAFEYDSGVDLYWPQKLYADSFAVDLDTVKEFFEFEHTKQAMLDVLSKIYSVRFTASHTKSWHENVDVIDIFDQHDQHIAQVHCDWFARADKQGHAWMNEFIVAEREHGILAPHIGCVIMNLDAPTKDTPCLMSIHSVETMWHEFGHFMHLAFSNTSLKEQSMMGVKRDFIEAPSQIMENWVLHKDILPSLGKHYRSGEVLSAEVVSKIQKLSHFNLGIKTMRQLHFALLDLKIHSHLEFETPKQLADFAKELKETMLPTPTMSYYAILSTFAHIIDGYSSGYYTYKWSEAIQADLFSRFEAEGVLNPEVGADYRDKILARGDEKDPDELIRDFLGRDFTVDAILRRDGLL